MPIWSTDSSPLYDINKSYLDNADKGPFFLDQLPHRKIESPSNDFLGFKLASKIGVPAGPLLNARWVSLAARLGFDLLCYKTIRSRPSPGHPLPNVIYVEASDQLVSSSLPSNIKAKSTLPKSLNELAITNSFGMPSRSNEYLKRDIPLAESYIASGQLMVVSVVGTHPQNCSEPSFMEDFINVALFAKECGAKVIEANFSCPNDTSGQGCVYFNPTLVGELSRKLVEVLGEVPLIIKVGLFTDREIMKRVLVSAARSGVRSVSGINTISLPVVNDDWNPALGQNRPTSGICGSPIRESALGFVHDARQIIDEEKLDLALIGCGGIVLPNHFSQFLNAGADIAMSATGMMWDPYLAMRYHEGI